MAKPAPITAIADEIAFAGEPGIVPAARAVDQRAITRGSNKLTDEGTRAAVRRPEARAAGAVWRSAGAQDGCRARGENRRPRQGRTRTTRSPARPRRAPAPCPAAGQRTPRVRRH